MSVVQVLHMLLIYVRVMVPGFCVQPLTDRGKKKREKERTRLMLEAEVAEKQKRLDEEKARKLAQEHRLLASLQAQ